MTLRHSQGLFSVFPVSVCTPGGVLRYFGIFLAVYIAIWISQYIEINVCREWMGHSDLKMIMKIYDHVSDERKAAELQKIYDEHKSTELGQNMGQLQK